MEARYLRDSDYYGRAIRQDHFNNMISKAPSTNFFDIEEDNAYETIGILQEYYLIEEEFDKHKFIPDYDSRLQWAIDDQVWYGDNMKKMTSTAKSAVNPVVASYWAAELVGGDTDGVGFFVGDTIYWTISETDVKLFLKAPAGGTADINALIPITVEEYGVEDEYGVNDYVSNKDLTEIYICIQENGYILDNVINPNVSVWTEKDALAWDNATPYLVGDLSTLSSVTYKAIADNTNKMPGVDPEWEVQPEEAYDYSKRYEAFDIVFEENKYWLAPDLTVNAGRIDLMSIKNDTRNKNIVKCMVDMSAYDIYQKFAKNLMSEEKMFAYKKAIEMLNRFATKSKDPLLPKVVTVDEDGDEVSLSSWVLNKAVKDSGSGWGYL